MPGIRKKTFYYFEGCDGSGKSTFAKKFLEDLKTKNPPPSGETGYSSSQRIYPEIIKFPTKYPEKMFKSEEAIEASLFYMTDFINTLKEVVSEDYDVYVFDRSFISTLVYQGYKIAMFCSDTPSEEDKKYSYAPMPVFIFNELGISIAKLSMYIFNKFNPTKFSVKHNVVLMNVLPDVCYERGVERFRKENQINDFLDSLLAWSLNEEAYDQRMRDSFKKEFIREIYDLQGKYIHIINYLKDNYKKYDFNFYECNDGENIVPIKEETLKKAAYWRFR